MTESYFPFDAGAGSSMLESGWTAMMRNAVVANGYVPTAGNELFVYADSTGMQVKVKSGSCWIMGHYYTTDAEIIKSIATSNPTNPRWDRVVVRLDWTNNTMGIVVITGTPAGSPSVPALTQSSTIWDYNLAMVYVDANVSTIAANKVYDTRNSCFGSYNIEVVIGNGVTTPSTGVLPTGIEIPWIGRIDRWTIHSDVSGSMVVDIWKDHSYNFPPTVADTIITSGKPTLSSSRHNVGGVCTVSGTPAASVWPGAILSAYYGDPSTVFMPTNYLLFNIDSASTLKQVVLSLRVQKYPFWSGI